MRRSTPVLIALAAGCSHPAEPGSVHSVSAASSAEPLVAATSGTPRLRVMTFNVNFGVADRQSNIDAIAESGADLVLLQETTEASEDRFVDALSDIYPHALFKDCCNAGGLGILSKHPIAGDTYLEPEAGWFPAWLVEVDSPIGRVQALDVHLRPPVSDSGSWVSGRFTTRKIRAQEIEAFAEAFDPDLPTIVAGDFNEGENGWAVQFLADRGMRSALPQVDPKAVTWHWPLKLGELSSMLDHIVYDARFVLLRAEVLDRGDSDHYPVVAELALKK